MFSWRGFSCEPKVVLPFSSLFFLEYCTQHCEELFWMTHLAFLQLLLRSRRRKHTPASSKLGRLAGHSGSSWAKMAAVRPTREDELQKVDSSTRRYTSLHRYPTTTRVVGLDKLLYQRMPTIVTQYPKTVVGSATSSLQREPERLLCIDTYIHSFDCF